MKNNILLLVDCQYDFIDGSLAVPGAKVLMGNLGMFLENFYIGRIKYDKVFFTVDWHPADHCSFKEQGGQWPAHCIQYTHGAAIDKQVFDPVVLGKVPYHVIEKGWDRDKEAYSAFERIPSQFNLPTDDHKVYEPEDTHIDIAGIAYDYCVKSCAIDLAKDGYDIRIMRQFCPQVAMESAKEATKEMREYKNIEIINSFLIKGAGVDARTVPSPFVTKE